MAKNAAYSYKNMTDIEKNAFEQSIKDDYHKLLQIQLNRNNNKKSQIYEEEFGYKTIDENRLEELANIYSEIKNENSKLAKKINTLVWLMVVESGCCFVKQGKVKNMHEKYPNDCSIEEMWNVFTKCFESFDLNYISSKKTNGETDKNNLDEQKNESSENNRFVAYFKYSLFNRFNNIYKKREKMIVLEEDDDGKKRYGQTVSVDYDRKNDQGDSINIQVEDPINYISAYEEIDTKVYLFSNLITKMMEHLGTDKRKANDTIKRMFRAFYTGDTIAFAKCDELDMFYQSMCKSENKILASCLDDFFDFILSCDIPKSIEQVKYSKIKKYKDLNSAVFANKNPEESPILYIPTEENNKKRFGFENLVYDAFSNKSNISEQIKKYDDFRNKYFFKCES